MFKGDFTNLNKGVILQTLKIELEDTLYDNVIQSGVDVQEKITEFLFELTDDGYPAITTEEAKKRVSESIQRYKDYPESFTEVNDAFWDDTEKRLLLRHQ